MKVKTWLKKNIAIIFRSTFQRFPLVLLLCLAAAIFGVWAINSGMSFAEGNILGQRTWLVLELAIPIFLGGYLYFEYRPQPLSRKALIFAISGALLFLYGFFVLIDPLHNQWQGIIHLVVTVVACSLWLTIPYFLGRDDFQSFFVHNISRFFWAVLFAALLAAGLCLIVFAIDQLLVPMDENIYTSILLVIANVFLLSLFFGQIPKKEEALVQYPSGLKVVFLYILLPLFAVYSVVFYIYGIRILATGVWPHGVVCPLALLHFAGGLLLCLVLKPLAQGEGSLLKKIQRWLPLTLIPTLILYIIAFYYRIEAYGFTEKRYYLLLIAIFVAVSLIWLLWKKGHKTAFVIIFGSAFAIASLVGPWSAYQVSCNSQAQRLDALLMANNMLDSDKNSIIASTHDLSFADRQGICSTITYLQERERHELTHLPPDSNIEENSQQLLGFAYVYSWEQDIENSQQDSNSFHYAIASGQPLPIDGYSDLIDIDYILNKNIEKTNASAEAFSTSLSNGVQLVVEFDSDQFSVRNLLLSKEGSRPLRIDLKQIAEKLYKNAESSELPQEDVSEGIFDFTSADGQIQARIIVKEIYASYIDSSEGGVSDFADNWSINFSGYLLIK